MAKAITTDKAETLLSRLALRFGMTRKDGVNGVMEITIPLRNGIPEYMDICIRVRDPLVDTGAAPV